jgi:hypothetical protein
LQFGGSWENYTVEEFADSAVRMAGHKDEWETARKIGGEILKKNHGEKVG